MVVSRFAELNYFQEHIKLAKRYQSTHSPYSASSRRNPSSIRNSNSSAGKGMHCECCSRNDKIGEILKVGIHSCHAHLIRDKKLELPSSTKICPCSCLEPVTQEASFTFPNVKTVAQLFQIWFFGGSYSDGTRFPPVKGLKEVYKGTSAWAAKKASYSQRSIVIEAILQITGLGPPLNQSDCGLYFNKALSDSLGCEISGMQLTNAYALIRDKGYGGQNPKEPRKVKEPREEGTPRKVKEPRKEGTPRKKKTPAVKS